MGETGKVIIPARIWYDMPSFLCW